MQRLIAVYATHETLSQNFDKSCGTSIGDNAIIRGSTVKIIQSRRYVMWSYVRAVALTIIIDWLLLIGPTYLLFPIFFCRQFFCVFVTSDYFARFCEWRDSFSRYKMRIYNCDLYLSTRLRFSNMHIKVALGDEKTDIQRQVSGHLLCFFAPSSSPHSSFLSCSALM